MKTKRMYILAFIAVSLISFTKNKNHDHHCILGKWQQTHVGVVIDGKEELKPIANQGCNAKAIYTEFKKTGTLEDVYYHMAPLGHDIRCEKEIVKNSWIRNGNQLIINYLKKNVITTATEEYEIISLTPTELKIKERTSISNIYDVFVFRRI